MTSSCLLLQGAPVGGSLGAFFVLFALLGTADPSLDEAALQALVAQARDGDPGAQRRVYEQVVDRVFRAVRPMFQDEAEAEDVTQDALIKALSSLHRYEPRPGSSFVSWVVAIGFNTARHRFRRRRPVPTEPEALTRLQEAMAQEGDPAEALERRQIRALVLRALWEVPEREREILSLRYGAELNASEIASIVNLKPAHIRKICERGRERLAQRIAALRAAPEAQDA